MAAAEPTTSGEVLRLKRVLTVWDLIFYGLVAVTPSAPATVFGLAQVKSHGHAVVTILAAMVAMVLTAISYGRMAALYPSAGSAYTYVGRGLHPYLGFVSGWAMLLDYVVCPLFCVIYGTLSLQRAFPAMPYWVGTALFAGGITYLNLRGIRSTARANQVLLVVMFVVLLGYIGLALRYILFHQGFGGLFSVKPFYAPGTFNVTDIAGATSFAALTYLGFDAVTTLAEDVKNPRRSVMLAAVSVCAFTGLFGGLLVYLGQIVWPDYSSYPNVETAFIDVTRRVGGLVLFQAMAMLLVVANIGAGLTSQVGAARLLYGMGRDAVIPRRFFSYLHPRRNTPDHNIWLIGILAYAGAQVLSYELTAEILNFGAFLGFMGVNLAVVWQFWVRRNQGHSRKFFGDIVLPVSGFIFCTIIWIGLGAPAKVAGGVWFVIGVFVLASHTRGFKEPLALPDPATYE
ncbi:MAG: APC family permease [Bryobacteraceae bacterium]